MLFNKPCLEDDWNNDAFQKILLENLHLPRDCLSKRERKHWEWAMGFLALEYYGYLNRSVNALGIACGHESFLYALTNYVNHVTATDLYGETPFSASEANVNILHNPEEFCNFPYEKDRLEIKRMDALDLKFPDETFDVLFSFSSVEHFGSNSQIKQAMVESYRVLKPGGIYVLSVDYLFKSPWPRLPRFIRSRESGESLTESEIFRYLIKS
ncbi:MAG: class I SAM-dependent methyltransferase, partial [Proteobacteria bacterium]|nr:class I SAM-dependent methyltransferase [Pseudomonadota bacterium]